MKKIALISGGVLLFPFIASAQADISQAEEFMTALTDFIGIALPVIISLAVLLFLFGLIKYMTNADDPEKRTQSRGLMVWGVVIIFVMISIWGLVNFLTNLFGLDVSGGVAPVLPT